MEWGNLDSNLAADTLQQLHVPQANSEFVHLRHLHGGGPAWNDHPSKYHWFVLVALQEMFIYPGFSGRELLCRTSSLRDGALQFNEYFATYMFVICALEKETTLTLHFCLIRLTAVVGCSMHDYHCRKRLYLSHSGKVTAFCDNQPVCFPCFLHGSYQKKGQNIHGLVNMGMEKPKTKSIGAAVSPELYEYTFQSWTHPIQGSVSPDFLSSCLSGGCCHPIWCSLVRVTVFVLASFVR